MSSPTAADLYAALSSDFQRKSRLEKSLSQKVQAFADSETQYQHLIEAQRLLSSISEENTLQTLEYITGVINRVLSQIFKGDGRSVELSKVLYRGRYAHVNVVLTTSNGSVRDLDLQTGQGLKEVISILFTICLIAVRGGRRLLIMDELLSGLHPRAKAIVADMLGVFVEEGFQFVVVEYGLDNIVDAHGEPHSFGKIYHVSDSAVHSVEDGSYSPISVSA